MVAFPSTAATKTFEDSEQFPVLNPLDQDLDAGTWTLKCLAGADAFAGLVPAPQQKDRMHIKLNLPQSKRRKLHSPLNNATL